MNNGALYLIPVPLAECGLSEVVPNNLCDLVATISIFIVENAKTARHWLKWFNHPTEMRQITIVEINERDNSATMAKYLAPLLEGKNIGLLSEAGCPGVADPGANVVREAHRLGIRVVPAVGPSSILLALMASGLNGQRFSFHGYLPVDRNDRAKAIVELEQRSRKQRETQIFIETPYRNDAMFRTLTDNCQAKTLLCLATDMTGKTESIATRTIGEWRKNIPNLDKRPTVFLLLAT